MPRGAVLKGALISRLVLGLGAGVAMLATAAPAGAETLHFDRVLPGTFRTSQCEAGSRELARCFLVEIGGLVRGLGRTVVRERVFQSGDVDFDLCEPQVRYGTIMAPRGTVEYVASGIDCPASREANGGYRAVIARWTVTGGTGLYAGATGGGNESVRPENDAVFIHLFGTIDVPGLVFDLTPPVFVPTQTIRTTGARETAVVRYARPAARDAVDGAVAVTCSPRSGSRFRVGRTIVRCEAVDSSGNVASARFTVLVRKGGP